MILETTYIRGLMCLALGMVIAGSSHGQRPPMHGNPGWFLDDWQPKKAKLPKNVRQVAAPETTPDAFASVDFGTPLTKVSQHIFGNHLGIWVNRSNVDKEEFILPLRDMGVSVIRYPGGNASNDFFWNASERSECPPGVPDTIWKNNGRQTPPKLGREGNFKFSPEHFYDLLLTTGATGSVCVNYSYALYGEEEEEAKRVQLAAEYAGDWVRHANVEHKLGIQFWEIGNENWGPWQAGYSVPGRGDISPKKYGEHCRAFIEEMKAADSSIKVGVVGYQKPKSNNPIQSRWNEEVLPEVAEVADYIILHDYFTEFKAVLSPEEMFASVDTAYSHIDVINKAWAETVQSSDPPLPIALTEFNTRSRATISAGNGATNVSHSAGLFISHALGEFIRQGYGSAMMWDISNGYADGEDHGVFASPKEHDVPELTPHPSFYHYYMYDKCFGDTYYDCPTDDPQLRVHASSFSSGEAGLVILNGSRKARTLEVELVNMGGARKAYQYLVHNDDPLSRKTYINGETGPHAAGGPERYWKVPALSWPLDTNNLVVDCPPFSASYVLIE